MEYKQKPIICPRCLNKVGTYEGRSTINKLLVVKNARSLWFTALKPENVN